MASDPIRDFVQAQQDFVRTVQKQVAGAGRGKAPRPEALLENRERFAEQSRARIGALEAARARAVERYDAEIRHQQELLTRVEGEISTERQRPQPRVRGGGDRRGGAGKPTGEVALEGRILSVAKGRRQVTGRVTDASGKQLPSLEVELSEGGGDKRTLETTTDAKGDFTFEDVSAGTLTVKLYVGEKVIEKKVSSRQKLL